MSCRSKFPVVNGGVDACSKRIFETEDIVTRLGVITPERVFIRNHPLSNPIAVFNPGAHEENNELKLYTRVITGYYMYVSSIVELRIPLDDLVYGYVNENKYVGNIVLYPSNKYDIWGTEDPRIQLINYELYMTYIGRTISFFNTIVKKNRTIPITAVHSSDRRSWIKKYVYNLSIASLDEIVSIKDASLHYYNENYYLLYRLHLLDDTFHVVYSSIDKEFFNKESINLEEVFLDNIYSILPSHNFEYKYGLSTPPLLLNETGRNFIVLLYGVDKENFVYRVFGLEISIDNNELCIEAITPRYIMEPRELYELIGDKPGAIYPTGFIRIDRENILITYGAGDSVIGFGLIDYNTLASELDRGRIY